MLKITKRILFLIIVLTGISFMLVSCGGPITEETLQKIEFADKTVDYNGEFHTIEVGKKPGRVKVTYRNNKQLLPGEYEATAVLTYGEWKVEKKAILTIKGYESIVEAPVEQNFYVNSEVVLEYTISNDLQPLKIIDEQGNVVDLKTLVKPGTYVIEIFAEKAGLFSESEHIKVTINIVKSMFDLSFTSKEVIADGTEHKLELTGTIPSGYSVEYVNNTGTEDGTYFAKALLKDSSGKVVETHQAVLTIDNPENAEFAAYLDEFFVTYLEDDQLSVNIFCENPEDFGLSHYEASWYTYESFDDTAIEADKTLFLELLEELEAYEEHPLNDLQEIAYDNIKDFLEHYIELFEIKDSTFMQITYVDQFGGYVADFGTYMEAYSLRSEQEVQDVVDYLISTKVAFPSYLDFLQDKLDKGYGLSDYTINEMRNYLKDILGQEEYYLVEILRQKIDKLSFLDDAAKEDYKKQIADAAKNYFMAGVKELYDGLEKFLGKVTEEETGYWAVYENGKALYELTLENLLGYDDIDMDTYIKEVDRALNGAVSGVISAQNAIVSAANISTWDQLQALLDKQSIFEGTPEEMMEYLKEFAKTIVPELETEPTINIKEMDEAAAKVSNAVAYYMKSALDNTAGENITLNPVKLKDSSSNDVLGTLAHEGYPGHLYAYVLSKESGLSNLSTIMTSTAHGEGWATYVELKLYEYAKELNTTAIFQKAMDYLYANQVAGFLLETRIDVGIHYQGWGAEEIKSLMDKLGYSSDSADEIYNLIIEMPTQYAAYGYGKIVYINIHDEAQEVLGGYYDEVEFNTMILSSGWVDLEILEENYEKYMEAKCFECGIEWNK